ncbi:hypothetical protein ESCO_003858 [Escovopsis weberi]|uniref:Uncharacterized protein n=1 Tax=Escovopsis weberi TaxID=150374 RepID=A0A0M9VX45_ESCWE|nr:hypothetical protein ESCO_003858 [Escovopsis weberi]
MSISNAPTPPLLLTKRLSAFLHTHQCPQLPTLLLITPHGKLLAHAASLSVALLRIHATVAASLFTIHTSSSVAIPSALPGSRTPERPSSPADRDRHYHSSSSHDDDDDDDSIDDDDDDDDGDEENARRARAAGCAVQPGTITVQLTGGTVVIRRLACGLLFVCVGPPANAEPGLDSTTNTTTTSGGGDAHHYASHHAHSVGGSSPSEADSLISAGAAGAGAGGADGAGGGPVAAMRRRAAELARKLDEKLGTLKVPGDGGVEIV